MLASYPLEPIGSIHSFMRKYTGRQKINVESISGRITESRYTGGGNAPRDIQRLI